MQTSEAEKDWLRRICGGQPVTEQKTVPAKEAEHKPVAGKKANGHGFGDIAGSTEHSWHGAFLISHGKS